MPFALAQSGWMGLCVLLVFAVLAFYTGVLLCRCMDSDPDIKGYPDVGYAAFGKPGRLIISCMLCVELSMVAVEFLIMMGDNLTQLVSWDGFRLGFIHLSAERSFIIISTIVLLPTVWLRHLTWLSYVSACGVLAFFTVFVVVACIGFFDVGFTSSSQQVFKLGGLPITIGMIGFSYCGHSLFPSIYGAMKVKTNFLHVLLGCFVLCTLLYGGMGVVGYLMFGDDNKSQVTLNLPQGSVATTVAIVATLVNPAAKYALTLTPVAMALDGFIPQRWQSHASALIFRTLLVASTTLVALTVPFFAYIMALIGSLLTMFMGIIVPCICYLRLFSKSISSWERTMVLLLALVGLVACVAGTYTSVLEIVLALAQV